MLPPDADTLLDKLARQPVPPPTPDRKAATLRAANLAFREKINAPAQRTGWLARLLGRTNPKESHMTIKGLLRGTAITLVALVTLSTSLDYISRYNPSESKETTAVDRIAVLSPGVSEPRSGGQLSDSLVNTRENRASAPDLLSALSAKPLLDAVTGGTDKGAGASAYQMIAPMDESDGATAKSAAQPAAPQQEFEALVNRSDSSGVEASSVPSTKVAPSLPAPGVNADRMIAPEYQQGSDRFANRADNPLVEVAKAPVSTFSADTDTAGYAAVRRWIQSGQLPSAEAVRTEEMVNYFDYDYATPSDKTRPFEPTVAVYPTPWNAGTRLLHIGIKAYDLPATAERPPVNLVLLLDVSGSMSNDDRLPLAKRSFAMMIGQLRPTDTVAIVTYAGSSGIALPPTRVADKTRILATLDSLSAGGSTAGAAGLATAYELAKENYTKEGVNRIILATDGDFNVGVSAPGGLAEYVARQRSSGVFLSVLGFGMGNYQDTTMQAIAQNGNGVAAYIDSLSEARRVLADQLTGTLFTVAKDVKFQVEFNPAQVKSYRLLGYETRALRREDFDNDKVDAGEVGAGHEVTAIYEFVPANADAPVPTDGTALRYQDRSEPQTERRAATVAPLPAAGELAFLRMRYKLPESDTSTLIERPVTAADLLPTVNQASGDVRFAAAVTGFSRLLRHSDGMGSFSLADVLTLAASARGPDQDGTRSEFIDLVRTAAVLNGTRSEPAEDGGVAFPPAQ